MRLRVVWHGELEVWWDSVIEHCAGFLVVNVMTVKHHFGRLDRGISNSQCIA